MNIEPYWLDNKFIKLLTNYCAPILKEVTKLDLKGQPILHRDKDGILRWTPIRDYNKKEYYVINNLLAYSETISSLTLIETCLYYIKHFSRSYGTKYFKINRLTHTLYHTEYFYVKLNGIYDRILISINETFNLGYEHSFCTEQNIFNNKHIDSNIIKELKIIKKFFDRFKNYRNQIIHRKTFSNKEIEKVLPYYIYLETLKDENQYKMYSEEVKYLTLENLKLHIKDLESIYNEIFKIFLIFTELMELEFDRIYKTF